MGLLGSRLKVEGSRARLTLQWRIGPPPGDPVVFVHLFNLFTCAGKVAALADGAPLGGAYPFRLARPGDRIEDVREFPIERSAADGCYSGEVGPYRPQDGARLSVIGPDGAPLPNDLVPLRPDL
ncbi:MAG: hypothetical protein HY784_13850 [Chloroflexi bacterium]|nr:hypothetical protein [Chloroflexota bacterium]